MIRNRHAMVSRNVVSEVAIAIEKQRWKLIACLVLPLTIGVAMAWGESGKSRVEVAVTAETEKAKDWEHQIAYQRGFEAVAWAMPAVSMMSMRDANFGLGGGYNTVYFMSQPPTPQAEALTPNNQTPYTSIHMTTKQGPVVLDIPSASERTAIFGSAVDVWQVPVADIGPAGTDQGRGGRYLFLPPGYDGEVPDGFFVVPMETYDIYVALRNIPLGDATFEEAAEYSRLINAYPLSAAIEPPPGSYVDMFGKHLPTLPEYDMSYFDYIVELVNNEPLLERDKVMGGMLASIGIARDVSFEPTGKLKAALQRAVKDSQAYLEYMFETPGYSMEAYWADRQWQVPRQPSQDGFVFDEGEYLLLDSRSSLFHWATFFPRHLGKASAYLAGLRDGSGALLSGDGVYRLSVPANVPARDFWSVIVYGKETKAFVYNDIGRVGLSSYDIDTLQVNEDSSIDLYFGESALIGKESNWIPTAGEDFFLLFRLYGPEEAYFDKSFTLPDIEKLN